MTYAAARPIYDLKNGSHDVPRFDRNEQIEACGLRTRATNDPVQDRKNKTMNTMNASLMMDKVGTVLINAALLAALPTALVAILVQAF